eukprot:216677-Lingulodinium_polyedra.AAC.1
MRRPSLPTSRGALGDVPSSDLVHASVSEAVEGPKNSLIATPFMFYENVSTAWRWLRKHEFASRNRRNTI